MSAPAPDARAAALREVQAAVRANDLPGATAKALAALDAGVEHPMLLNLRALKAEEEGRAADALPDLERARALAPADFTIANALGLCLARLERYGEAAAAFDAAIALEPRFAPAYHNKGWVSDLGGDAATARACHELALKMNPGYAEASAALAMLAVRAGDMARARELAEKTLGMDRNQRTAQVALAAAEIAAGEAANAEVRLRLLLSGDVRRMLPEVLVTARGLWADALDRLDRTAEAFAAYGAEKAEMAALNGARLRGKGPAGVMGFIGWARDYFETASAWRAGGAGPAAGARSHVFVVGMPGSGVELIAQALASDPAVALLADRDALADGVAAFMTGAEALERLDNAPASALNLQRDRYWRRVRAMGIDPKDRIVVDAAPLNLLRLPLIVRLFPAATVLLARRDPRDVVLDGLRRHFKLNAANLEMLTADGAARFQDAVLGLGKIYAEKLPVELHVVRHEALAADPAGEAARIAALTGVAATAPPAAAAPGGWRRYGPELEAVAPILAPWIERFDYPRR